MNNWMWPNANVWRKLWFLNGATVYNLRITESVIYFRIITRAGESQRISNLLSKNWWFVVPRTHHRNFSLQFEIKLLGSKLSPALIITYVYSHEPKNRPILSGLIPNGEIKFQWVHEFLTKNMTNFCSYEVVNPNIRIVTHQPVFL